MPEVEMMQFHGQVTYKLKNHNKKLAKSPSLLDYMGNEMHQSLNTPIITLICTHRPDFQI